MPVRFELDAQILEGAAGKTVIVTGGANGIGAATVSLYNRLGANVVVADLPSSQSAAEALIRSLPRPESAAFIAVNILDWAQMTGLFKETVRRFGSVDVVVANAGIMETSPVLDEGAVDENGDLLESKEAFRVIDVNLKGTLNTLRLALHHMKNKKQASSSSAGSGGSIVMLASTSGYFGGSGVAAYIASKHGVVGLLRASQAAARRSGIRVNAVAPFVTPTHITASYSADWLAAGLPANTPESVARVVAQTSLDESRHGNCILGQVAGESIMREMELPHVQGVGSWLGDDFVELITIGGKFFESHGGYPLPTSSVG
ncbi:dehydrogenase with different specificitie [Xylariales sp. PMI_506]|nr:dehydrogenase with different specificitie [Xylariales sp. PMI_506]